jgi:hypothetical protein
VPEQHTYQSSPTARIRLYELWDEGDERGDEELAAVIGCSPSTVTTYRQDWRHEQEADEVVEVREGQLPLLTVKGWVWCEPVEIHGKVCEPWSESNPRGCVMYEMCQVAVRDGNFVACEWVLRKELLPEREGK